MSQLNVKLLKYKQFSTLFVPLLLLCLHCATFHTTQAAPYYDTSYRGLENSKLTSPSEVLPIQPLLIYPQPAEQLYQARNFDTGERDIIFIKLLPRKGGYRPKHQLLEEEKSARSKEIFYVKALTNGQFSSERLKVYRLPEFYAISVFSKAAEK